MKSLPWQIKEEHDSPQRRGDRGENISFPCLLRGQQGKIDLSQRLATGP